MADSRSRRVRAALLVVLFVGFSARVAWVALEGSPPTFASDPEAYLLQGETIARGEGYANPLIDIENVTRKQQHQQPLSAVPGSFYPPGYPMFIAAVTWTVWHTPIPDTDLVRTLEYVQAVLGTLTILFVFLLARRAFDERAGLLAAAIVAVYPNLIATTATLQFETVFITLVLATMLVLLPAATGDDPRRARLIVSGALIGGVALIHPTICLLILAFLAARLTLRRPWRDTVRDLLILSVCTVAVIAPWTIRNAVELHAFVPIATGAGPALCQSRNPEATGAIDIGVLERQCRPKHTSSSPPKREVEVNSYATSHAIRWVLQHPASELHMWWRRTDLAYRIDTSGLYAPKLTRTNRRHASTVANIASFAVLSFAVLGAAVALTKRRRPSVTFLVMATIGFAAVPIILFGDPRYRVPAEPLFAIFAAAGIGAAIELIPSRP